MLMLPSIPQSELYSYSPKVHYGETLLPGILERFALQAEEKKKRRREAEMLKELDITVPGYEPRPEPKTWLGKIGRGLGDVFAPGPAPMSELQKEILKAKIKQKYPSATDLLTTTLLSRELGGLAGGVREIPERPTAELPEGYEYELAEDTVRGVPVKRWEVKKTPEDRPIYTEKLDRDLTRAIKGKIGWGEVRTMYPTKTEKIDKIHRQHMLLTKSPKFKMGTGGLVSRFVSWYSPRQAEITPATKRAISNIKSQADLDELVKNYEKYEDAGVDVKALLEFFGKEEF